MSLALEAEVAAVARLKMVPTILDVICDATGMGLAAVAQVTEDRWVACSVCDKIGMGLQPGQMLELDTTIRHAISRRREPVVINDLCKDPSRQDQLALATDRLQSYVAVPIVLPDNSLFGALCAVDPHPSNLNATKTLGMFAFFAELIAFHLSASAELASSQANLLDARKTAELREQFIAVLGHDLRNPLSAIYAGAQMLQRGSLDQKQARTVELIEKSADRMAGLINDVMDFARGQLGSGLPLDRTKAPLAPVLQHVVAELQATHPDRIIETDIAFDDAIVCDQTRIGQLLSNLVGNALTYGLPDKPIQITAMTDAAKFQLAVTNAGNPIPAAAMERLFQPFSRGEVRPSQQGLGLGLFIAWQIAIAHEGKLDVTSSSDETRFTFCMPITHDRPARLDWLADH